VVLQVEPPPPKTTSMTASFFPTFACTYGSFDLTKSTVFGALFLVASYLFLERGLEHDYSERDARIATIIVAAFGGLFCLLCTSSTSAFNTFLGYYLGLEIYMIQETFAVARDIGGSFDEMQKGWAWASGFVILFHLLPFLLINKSCLLYLLAYVGLLVNIITILYVEPLYHKGGHLLLLYGASGAALITATTLGKCSLSYRQLVYDAVEPCLPTLEME
jgi:hypothetical protein